MSDQEFADLKAVESIVNIVKAFETDDRVRILRWVVEKLGISLAAKVTRPSHFGGTGSPTERSPAETGAPLARFASAAELLGFTTAHTDAERALVVASYMQTIGGKQELAGQEINSELKHLGYGCKNITDALTTLQNLRPAFVIQLRKSGSSKQARKQYRVTAAGLQRVTEMVSEASGDVQS